VSHMVAHHESLHTATMIELDHEVARLFRGEAAKRDTTVPRLILALLDVIAVDGLTTAILDDDGGHPGGRG
jgi:spermidine synthase